MKSLVWFCKRSSIGTRPVLDDVYVWDQRFGFVSVFRLKGGGSV